MSVRFGHNSLFDMTKPLHSIFLDLIYPFHIAPPGNSLIFISRCKYRYSSDWYCKYHIHLRCLARHNLLYNSSHIMLSMGPHPARDSVVKIIKILTMIRIIKTIEIIITIERLKYQSSSSSSSSWLSSTSSSSSSASFKKKSYTLQLVAASSNFNKELQVNKCHTDHTVFISTMCS